MKYKGKLYLKSKINNEKFTRFTEFYDSEDELIVDIATKSIITAQEELISYEVVPITNVQNKIVGVIGKDIDIVDFITKYNGMKATIIFE